MDIMFQSTHPRGVRQSRFKIMKTILLFQSTHPRGVRLCLGLSKLCLYYVSIHAPTRGATLETSPNLCRNACFNPRTHEGCDKNSFLLSFLISSFNPRTHEGCDRLTDTLFTHKFSFNPRTHEGCDIIHLLLSANVLRFQSTHPRGVRLPLFTKPLLSIIRFNPRTHEGCDLAWLSGKHMTVSFNPRTHEGCDDFFFAFCYRTAVSIHAPTRGATGRRDWLPYSPTVSIHAPTRGATAYSAKYRILIYKSSHFANINQTITFKVIKSLEFL